MNMKKKRIFLPCFSLVCVVAMLAGGSIVFAASADQQMDTQSKTEAFYNGVDYKSISAEASGQPSVYVESTEDDIQPSGTSTYGIEIGTEPARETFSVYEQYGLTYDTANDKLYYQGKLVRYFEDVLQTGETAYAKYLICNYEEGEIAVRTVYDEKGNLKGLEAYTQEEFNAMFGK